MSDRHHVEFEVRAQGRKSRPELLERNDAHRQRLATIDVAGGTPNVDIAALVARADQNLVSRGYPPQFLYPPLINSAQVQAVTGQLPHLRGRYRLIAKTPIDLYPHIGPFGIDVELEPVR